MTPELISLAASVAAVIVFSAVCILALRRGMRALQRRGEMRRAEALMGPAARLGFAPVQDPSSVPADVPAFELLNTGRDRRASNVMRGTVNGLDSVLFDYKYFDVASDRFRGLGYGRDLFGCTIVCLRESWLSLPVFVMEPCLGELFEEQVKAGLEKQGQTALQWRLGKVLVNVAIHLVGDPPGWSFPERPDFHYRVRGDDERAVRGVFTPAVFDHFRNRPGYVVEGRAGWLLVTRPSHVLQQPASTNSDEGRLPAAQVESLVAEAIAALNVFRGAAR